MSWPKHLAAPSKTAGFTWSAPELDDNARVVVPWTEVARRGPDGRASLYIDAIAMHHMVNELRAWEDGVRYTLAHGRQIPPAPDGCRLHANPE